jgi:alpha-L-rhamnosidase
MLFRGYDADYPSVYPEELLCEYTNNPLGVDIPQPRFSFRIPTIERPGWSLIAYQLQVIDDDDSIIWDTGTCNDARRIHLVYSGEPLNPFSCYHWRVRLMGRKDVWEPWSPESRFETALFSAHDLCAKWISAPDPTWYQAGQWESGVPHQQTSADEGKHTYGIYLHSVLTLQQPSKYVKRARAFVTGVGVYRLYLDQKNIGEHILSPAQTDYKKRVLYDVLPLDAKFHASENQRHQVVLFLGNGRHIALYGYGKPRGFVQILIDYEDGNRQWFCSDEQWEVIDGPIRENSLFNGEIYDSTIKIAPYETPTVSANGRGRSAAAMAAEVVESYPIQAAALPPITIELTLEAKRMWKTPDGYVYDFGQNFAGFVRIVAKTQPKGTRLILRFAELVDNEGNLNPSSNRKAQATDIYICDGGPVDWHPVSTYHGFRYVLLCGYTGVPTLHTLQGLFTHTETQQRGTFGCSHQGLNRVHEAILWGLRSNMMGIPTDSPQRDERHGWLGDALLAAPAALLNYEATLFYEKYLQDIVDTQNEDGSITDVAPSFWMDKPADPAWGSAFISIAWYLYLYRGDEQVLQRFFPQMQRYIDFLLSQTDAGIVTDLGTFGDWCAPGLVTSKKTGLPFISTWYLHHDLALMENIARVVGDEYEKQRYMEEMTRIGEALMAHYWKGTYMESLPMTPWDFPDQSSQAMALASDVLETEQASDLATYLDNLVAATSGDHVGTGIHGTKYLLEQLTRWGHQEKAFIIATQESYPGWLYMLREGATTLWERWEHITCEGMNSHNHIMLGSIDQWFYEKVAGIMPMAAGWREIGFAPARFSKLTFASASVETPYGEAALSWERDGTKVRTSMTVPQGTRGLLFLRGIYNDYQWESLSYNATIDFVLETHPLQPYPLDSIGYYILTPGNYSAVWDETTNRDETTNFEMTRERGKR